MDTIGDVDYSDEAADEGSALKNGAEDSPTTVRGALDLLDTKIGSLNETGIAGDDVATQLKYILENGSTGGAGVTLSTLGYIGANTPYLNTTNNAMNFSSTYTIGGNLSTLANQIKTNETNIDNLSSRINSLSTYSGTLDLTDNYAKVIGDVNLATNETALVNDGINTKAYATPNKSYTVEIDTGATSDYKESHFIVQVKALDQTDAIDKAKSEIISNGWVTGSDGKIYNKYLYESIDSATENTIAPIGVNASGSGSKDGFITQIRSATVADITENNYLVQIERTPANGAVETSFTVAVQASNQEEADAKARQMIYQHISHATSSGYRSVFGGERDGITWGGNYEQTKSGIEVYLSNSGGLETVTFDDDLHYVTLGNGTVIENIALLDSAIGDLSATGVSGNSVAAQLKLLGEVGSEALGQKIGSWTATKDSIWQTLGDETKNYGYLTAFEYDSENEQYVGTVGDNLQALDTALSLTAKGLDALSYDLYNYYYTFRMDKISETAEFALFLNNEKLSNVFEA